MLHYVRILERYYWTRSVCIFREKIGRYQSKLAISQLPALLLGFSMLPTMRPDNACVPVGNEVDNQLTVHALEKGIVGHLSLE